MVNREQRTEEAITGLRKLVQDLVAPEVSGIKAKLDAIRDDIKASEKRLEEKIDSAKREILLTVE